MAMNSKSNVFRASALGIALALCLLIAVLYRSPEENEAERAIFVSSADETGPQDDFSSVESGSAAAESPEIEGYPGADPDTSAALGPLEPEMFITGSGSEAQAQPEVEETVAEPTPHREVWTSDEVLGFMENHSARAFFSRLFRDGGFRVGMLVGLGDGRFAEHFMVDNAALDSWTWYMVEPSPSPELLERVQISISGANFQADVGEKSWAARQIGGNCNKIFIREPFLDDRLLRDVADGSLDFVYLDGGEIGEDMPKTLSAYWHKIREGGVLAGGGYCRQKEDYGSCQQCAEAPMCDSLPTAEGGVDILMAIQLWLLTDTSAANTQVHYTREMLSTESLAAEQIAYDLTYAPSKAPSWFAVKPERASS